MLDRMGMSDPTEDAVAELAKRGFVMKDVQAATGIPGMNAAMLRFIPAEERDEIMRQMNLGAAGAMQGPTVVSVDENATMPDLDFADTPSISFEEFMGGVMQEMMQQLKQIR